MLCTDYEGIKHLWNDGEHLPDNTVNLVIIVIIMQSLYEIIITSRQVEELIHVFYINQGFISVLARFRHL